MVFVNVLLDVGTETGNFKGYRQRDFFPDQKFGDFVNQVSQLQAGTDIFVRLAELFYQIFNGIPFDFHQFTERYGFFHRINVAAL
jgi:hypothetical protein